MSAKHAVQRIVKDVKNNDERIQITGKVSQILDDDYIVIEDKSGEIKVSISNVDFTFKKNDLINVIGELEIRMNNEKVLQAQIIQDMKNLNFTYYLKLYELKKELE